MLLSWAYYHFFFFHTWIIIASKFFYTCMNSCKYMKIYTYMQYTSITFFLHSNNLSRSKAKYYDVWASIQCAKTVLFFISLWLLLFFFLACSYTVKLTFSYRNIWEKLYQLSRAFPYRVLYYPLFVSYRCITTKKKRKKLCIYPSKKLNHTFIIYTYIIIVCDIKNIYSYG